MPAVTIYEALENSLLQALAPLSNGGAVEVCLFPDEDSEFKISFIKPRISIRYHSFSAGDQVSIATSSAAKPVSLQIMFEAKKTRGPLGIYDLEVQVEDIVDGLKLTGYKPFTIGAFNFGERERGVWTYNLIIKTEGVSNQKIDTISNRWNIPGL
jgi:hypothetical protein